MQNPLRVIFVESPIGISLLRVALPVASNLHLSVFPSQFAYNELASAANKWSRGEQKSMDISPQIEAVFRRALLLRQRATESPIQQDLIEEALKELYHVLDELQASEEDLRRQNQQFSSTEIPASELAHIFEKFYCIPSSAPWKQGGTGLGLALVQKLTEHLGGTIQVECDANQLTFTVP